MFAIFCPFQTSEVDRNVKISAKAPMKESRLYELRVSLGATNLEEQVQLSNAVVPSQ